jgi:Putative stress-responsive transcriptional regulator
MEGIEERMAELLIEKCGSGGVVSIGVVSSVIETLGKPEAIENESDSFEEPDSRDFGQSESRQSGNPKNQKKAGGVKKRLYRDTANGKIAGVCSGLGTFLNIDPLVFRLVFVALMICAVFTGWDEACFFSPLLVYVVLWICMPAARTVRQKDEMRGVEGNRRCHQQQSRFRCI